MLLAVSVSVFVNNSKSCLYFVGEMLLIWKTMFFPLDNDDDSFLSKDVTGVLEYSSTGSFVLVAAKL